MQCIGQTITTVFPVKSKITMHALNDTDHKAAGKITRIVVICGNCNLQLISFISYDVLSLVV